MNLSSLSSDSHLWMMLGLLMVAAGLLLGASAILLRAVRQGRSERMIDQVLASRQQQALAALRAATAPGGLRAKGDDDGLE
ncbi:type II secretion system F family protein, partial [Pandoraea apista]